MEMADNAAQFANNTQDVARSILDTIKGVTEIQFNIFQRLGSIQQDIFKGAVEAGREQLQLASRVRDPREFASVQADLVKKHGQRYADSLKQAVDVVAKAWQEHANCLK
jgi:hypothetical protein